MGFSEAVKVGLNKFYSPYGRSGRSEFWWYWLFCVIIAGLLGVIGGFVSGHGGHEQTWVGIIFDILSAVVTISIICAEIRRLHDTGRSGWNFCWSFIPVIGGIYVIVLLCQATQPGTNKYGEAGA